MISTVPIIDDKVMSYAGDTSSNRGTGGLITKLRAAKMVTEAGIPMFLVNGEKPDILYDLFEGKQPGTYFMSR